MHEALLLKRAAQATCAIVTKALTRRGLTDPEKRHLADRSMSIVNTVHLLHHGDLLGSCTLRHDLYDLTYGIVLSLMRERYPERDLAGMMRDLFQDLAFLARGHWLSDERGRQSLEFWQAFCSLAEAVEAEGIEVLELSRALS